MKKILTFLVFLFLLLNISLADVFVYEKPDIKIIVEGNALQLDNEVPVIVNSRTLVPLRKLLIGLGVPDNTENIKWIGEKRQVKVVHNNIKIELTIDDLEAYINGEKYKLDSAPIIYRNRTYLPARFVGEALGYTISWDQYTPAVLVTSNENVKKITQIFDNLGTVMSNTKSYEVFTEEKVKETSNINGKLNTLEYTISALEKADIINKTIYTEKTYKSDIENNINYSYYTPSVFYNCYKYIEDEILYNTGWNIWDYSGEQSNVFEDKSKVAIFNVDKDLYGSFLCTEHEDSYEISTVSNQIDVLKLLGEKRLYEETFSYNSINNLDFRLIIDKVTKLPMSLNLVVDMGYKEDNKNKISANKKIEYVAEFVSYNENVELVLPKP